MNKITALLISIVLLCSLDLHAQRKKKDTPEPKTEEKKKDPFNSGTFSGLKFRSIGPALTSGRISDFAINPENHSEYYVAVSSGGVWKTTNAGLTYKPIFDGQSSYSIGCVEVAPSNPHVVWVGTGENNGQRSVAYGDGVYKSIDGGRSWKNMGLKESEHIGQIYIHPKDENIVFVAAQGPLWSDGGDRGLYKTTDGGKSWNKVLEIDEYTGVNEVIADPRDPNIMYASSWQRARKVWTFIGGGPGSAIYKSTDGGENWFKSQSGIPGGDLGRIGLAISPANPDVIYAILEATDGKDGFYRSTNRGASWEKRSGYSTSSNYYQEIIADPFDVDRVYAMNTYAMVTNDGGKSFQPLGEKNKHVDNHCMWIDPNNKNHYLIGCDGGIYESWDRAENWHYKPNLPITQFYKVATDNAEPFYNVYGGTQDNFSLGGPSQTINAHGITNSDWYVTNGGDGFESQIDPEDPNIVYAQAQYGWIVRFDKKSGESINIQPQPGKDEPGLRWNWDAPLLISPHKHTRLYFAANKLFKSEDRGNTWEAISGDLSRQIDRNALPVQGKVWSIDAVAKNRSTSIYGNIVALSESPVTEGLLYVGTDDGLVHVSENTGGSWAKMESFPGVPDMTYVNMLLASQHDENTVYAAFNNHKNGDFKPYLLKSTDKGSTWTSIATDLPERGSVYCIAEDHVNPNLLFVGTEFGVFFTVNGGEKWIQLKSGLPTIAVRDMEIQKRENDLVLATFGRGFYVLDNYTPLRHATAEILASDAHIFPVEDALMYVEARPIGSGGGGFLGESYFRTPNPDVAATFTYFYKEAPKTEKQKRKEAEKEAVKDGKNVSYPSFDQMRTEDQEEKPYLLFTITDDDGEVVNRIKTATSTGIKRLEWNLRYPATTPISLRGGGGRRGGSGHRVLPGTYKVSLALYNDGAFTELVEPQSFTVKPLNNTSLPAADREAMVAFQDKVSELRRSIRAASSMHRELSEKLNHIKEAVRVTPKVPTTMLTDIRKMELRLDDLSLELNGDRTLSRHQFETAPGISSRLESIVYGMWNTTSAPTTTQKQAYDIAAEEFEPVYEELLQVVKDIRKLEESLEDYGAPYTPGRIPVWNRP